MNSRSKLLLCSVLIRFIIVLVIATIARAEAKHQENYEIFTIKGDTNEVIYWSIN
jgi:predicted secreted Zn-dependent protease